MSSFTKHISWISFLCFLNFIYVIASSYLLSLSDRLHDHSSLQLNNNGKRLIVFVQEGKTYREL